MTFTHIYLPDRFIHTSFSAFSNSLHQIYHTHEANATASNAHHSDEMTFLNISPSGKHIYIYIYIYIWKEIVPFGLVACKNRMFIMANRFNFIRKTSRILAGIQN